MIRHFISLKDASPAQIERLIAAASRLKSVRKSGKKAARPLDGMSVALLFEKPSLRTRVTFEVAVSELGGRAIYLGPQEVGLGKRESVPDIARNLSRWVHAIVARTFKHDTVVELAEHASVPVINALTDFEHPCQAIGDLQTVFERGRRLKGKTLAFVGDGNNVCNSLLYGAAKTGMSMRVACPAGYEPAKKILDEARVDARRAGGSIDVLHDPAAAVRGADAVYTDVWVSMGFEEEAAERKKAFAAFQVDSALMSKAAPGAVFLHCLPARRGEEVTDDVMDGGQSAILDQAENRLHSAKAILMALLAPKEFEKSGKPKRRT